MDYTIQQLEAAIAQSYRLAEDCRLIIVQQRGIRKTIREQLEQARHAERVAQAALVVKRPRGRPPKPEALTNAERQRRFKEKQQKKENKRSQRAEARYREKLHKQAQAMSTPEVEVICVLKRIPPKV